LLDEPPLLDAELPEEPLAAAPEDPLEELAPDELFDTELSEPVPSSPAAPVGDASLSPPPRGVASSASSLDGVASTPSSLAVVVAPELLDPAASRRDDGSADGLDAAASPAAGTNSSSPPIAAHAGTRSAARIMAMPARYERALAPLTDPRIIQQRYHVAMRGSARRIAGRRILAKHRADLTRRRRAARCRRRRL
jgi:hypothetical protein